MEGTKAMIWDHRKEAGQIEVEEGAGAGAGAKDPPWIVSTVENLDILQECAENQEVLEEINNSVASNKIPVHRNVCKKILEVTVSNVDKGQGQIVEKSIERKE